jgi:ketosteroid isomerase-like protein
MKSQMTKDNLRLVREFYEAVSCGNLEVARTELDLDIEWFEPEVPGLWTAGPRVGREQVFAQIIVPLTEKVELLRLRMKKLYAVGMHVIAIEAYTGFSKETGSRLNADTAHIWTILNGKAVRLVAYHTPEAWQEAFIKPESDERIAA